MEKKKEIFVQRFKSFEEADKADKLMYKNMTMDERFQIYLRLRDTFIKIKYGTDPGFQRVYSTFKRKQN